MSVILDGIKAVLLMLLGAFGVAVLGTIIWCTISDFFECRKLYNRVRDISCGCRYWDKETYEQKFKPVECTCRDKNFKVEVKQSFSLYRLNVMDVYINNELAVTVWKSESLFLKHYGHDCATGKACCYAEIEDIIKSAQKVASKMWDERIEKECKKDSYFE